MADPTAGASALAELAGLVGPALVTEPATVETYRQDWSRDPHAGTPLAVVRAEHAGHVQATLAWASEHIHIVRETEGAESPGASDNETTAGVAGGMG